MALVLLRASLNIGSIWNLNTAHFYRLTWKTSLLNSCDEVRHLLDKKFETSAITYCSGWISSDQCSHAWVPSKAVIWAGLVLESLTNRSSIPALQQLDREMQLFHISRTHVRESVYITNVWWISAHCCNVLKMTGLLIFCSVGFILLLHRELFSPGLVLCVSYTEVDNEGHLFWDINSVQKDTSVLASPQCFILLLFSFIILF